MGEQTTGITGSANSAGKKDSFDEEVFYRCAVELT
jgi:hypothetical protein